MIFNKMLKLNKTISSDYKLYIDTICKEQILIEDTPCDTPCNTPCDTPCNTPVVCETCDMSCDTPVVCESCDMSRDSGPMSDAMYYNRCIYDYSYFFTSKQEETEAIDIYVRSKKIKNVLDRFIKRYKFARYKKYEFYKDLLYNDFENYDASEIIQIVENKTVYSFRTLDLIQLLKICLHNNEQMFPMPQKLKNPYTNVLFKTHNLYNIFFKFSKTTYVIPSIIIKYYKSDFDIDVLKNRSFPRLQEIAIDDYVRDGYYIELYDILISMSHRFRRDTGYVLLTPQKSKYKKSNIVNLFKKTIVFYLKCKYLCNVKLRDVNKKLCVKELKKNIYKYNHIYKFLHLSVDEIISYESSIIRIDETIANTVTNTVANTVTTPPVAISVASPIVDVSMNTIIPTVALRTGLNNNSGLNRRLSFGF